MMEATGVMPPDRGQAAPAAALRDAAAWNLSKHPLLVATFTLVAAAWGGLLMLVLTVWSDLAERNLAVMSELAELSEGQVRLETVQGYQAEQLDRIEAKQDVQGGQLARIEATLSALEAR